MASSETADHVPPHSAFPSGFHAWSMVGVLVLASLVSYLDRQILNLLVDPVRRDLAISDTQIGLLQGLGFSVFYSIAGLWFGGLVDRYNRRNIIACAIAAWSVMTIFCGMADSFAMLFIGRIGVAVGEAALMPAAYSLLSDLFHPHHRGRAAGVFGTGMAMGNGLSMIASSFLIAFLDPPTIARFPDFLPHVQWKLVFMMVGALGIPAALLILLAGEPRRIGLRDPGVHVPATEALRFVRRNLAAFAGLLCSSAALLSIGNGLSAWGPTILIREFGQTPAQAGMGYGVTTVIGGVAGPLLLGWLSDRLAMRGMAASRLRTYLVGGPLAAVGAVVVMFAGSPEMLLFGNLIVMLCVHGFAMILYTATQDVAPAMLRGRVVAVTAVFINVVGIAMGPLLVAMAGEYAASANLPLTWGYGIVAIPLALVGTLIAWWGIKPFSATEHRMRGA